MRAQFELLGENPCNVIDYIVLDGYGLLFETRRWLSHQSPNPSLYLTALSLVANLGQIYKFKQTQKN